MNGLAVDVPPQLWRVVVVIIAAAALAVGVRRLGRLAMAAEAERRARAREVAAAIAQYGLLFGFAAVAAGISAQGLTGFARDNMGLRGPWPYLLFFALDGAAGLCAVLLLRRAARAESAIAPRVAVWGLVAASSAFNAAHAPERPGARAAFALMPVIAAVLFEFSLRETRRTAGRADRRLAGLRWLHLAERIRVQLILAADETMPAAAATRRVRINNAARRLYRLRLAIHAHDQAPEPAAASGRRVRRAERRAHAALTRAGFADPAVAAEVVRQLQVLTLTPALATADRTGPQAGDSAQASPISGSAAASSEASIAALTTIPAPPCPDGGRRSHALGISLNGHPPGGPRTRQAHPAPHRGTRDDPASQPPKRSERRQTPDGELVDAARSVIAEAERRGVRLTQAALARGVRAQGHRIANDRLRWLASACGLQPPDGSP